MEPLETWKTAVSSIAFSVFLEITVLLKNAFQLKLKKSSFPLPPPSDPKTGEILMAETISMKNRHSIFADPLATVLS